MSQWATYLPNPVRELFAQNGGDGFFPSLDFTIGATGTAAATQRLTLTQDADSYFIITGLSRVITNSDNTTFHTQAGITIQIKMSSSGREVMDVPAHLENIAGTAQRPAIWPVPKVVGPAATMAVTLVSFEAATRIVRLTFYGYKVWRS